MYLKISSGEYPQFALVSSVLGDMEISLFFLWLLDTAVAQFVENPPRWKQGP